MMEMNVEKICDVLADLRGRRRARQFSLHLHLERFCFRFWHESCYGWFELGTLGILSITLKQDIGIVFR